MPYGPKADDHIDRQAHNILLAPANQYTGTALLQSCFDIDLFTTQKSRKEVQSLISVESDQCRV